MNRRIFAILCYFILALGCQKSDEHSGQTPCEPSEKTPCEPSGKYLLVETESGFANRLRVLASATVIAYITDRHLVVYWKKLENEIQAKWSNIFSNPIHEIQENPYAIEGCSLESIESIGENDPTVLRLGYLGAKKGMEHLDAAMTAQQPIVYYTTAKSYQPDKKYISDAEYQKRYREFYQSLKPLPAIKKEIDEFKDLHNFKDKYMVGVHYRAWDTGQPDGYVHSDTEGAYIKEFIDHMLQAVNLPRSQTDNKDVYFFLASDNDKIKQQISRAPQLQDRIFIRKTSVQRKDLAGQISAVVDWYLLGSTNYILGTIHSSFSDEAKYLTVQNKKIDLGESAFRDMR